MPVLADRHLGDGLAAGEIRAEQGVLGQPLERLEFAVGQHAEQIDGRLLLSTFHVPQATAPSPR